MHGQAAHLGRIERKVSISSAVEYLISYPLTKPHSHVDVILEVPIDLARPQVVDHVKLALADDEVVSQRARDSLTCGSAGILGHPHRQECLARERFTLQEVYNVLQIAYGEAVAHGSLVVDSPAPGSSLIIVSHARLLRPEPLHVVVVIALGCVPLMKRLTIPVVRPAVVPVSRVYGLTCYTLLEMAF